MNNLFYVCLVGSFFTSSKLVIAQQNALLDPPSEFKRYVDTKLQPSGITGKMPDGFVFLEGCDHRKPKHWKLRKNEQSSRGFIVGPTLQSNNQEAIIMYNYLPFYQSESQKSLMETVVKVNRKLQGDTSTAKVIIEGTNQSLPRLSIAGEIWSGKGLPFESMDSLFVFEDHVTTVSGKIAREMFNVDTVHFYDVLLDEPFKDNYVYCTGMVMTQSDRPSMMLKWYFTEEGKKKEREYIEQLRGNLWYEDEWNFGKDNRFIPKKE